MRDLAWACFSPQMIQIAEVVDAASDIRACALQLTPARSLWLQRLDRHPDALLQHLATRSTHRLGVYFEQLWHFFLQQDPDIELTAHNLPIRAQGRTLGEFDCIYYCKARQCHVHLELAVKFFLGVPRGGDTTSPGVTREWLGPDQRDRLQTKLDQLLQRQILLSDSPAAKLALQEIGVATPVKEIALKGYLFQTRADSPPPPPAYNSASAMAYWVTCAQLSSHCAALEATAFAILPKMLWLSPAQWPSTDQPLALAQLRDEVTTRLALDSYPLLVAVLDDNGGERHRFFVTPDNWPDQEALPWRSGNR